MKLLLTILLSLFTGGVFAQLPHPAMQWIKNYGGNATDYISNNVYRFSDGGFIIRIGTSSNSGTGNLDSFCIYVERKGIFLKFNSDASILEWSKCYAEVADSGMGWIFPQYDGGDILVGGFGGRSNWGFFVTKHNGADSVVWQHNYSKGNDVIVWDAIRDDENNYLFLCISIRPDSNAAVHYGSFMDQDLLVIKTDSNGNKLWSRVLGGTGFEYGKKLINAPGHGCYVVGSTSSNDYDCTGNHGGNYDVYLARLDSMGGMVWHRDLGGTGDDFGNYAIANGKGGIILCAEAYSSNGDIYHHIGYSDFWVTEVDSNGMIVWENCYGGPGIDKPAIICQANDNSLWVGGSVYESKGTDIDTNYDRIRGDGWLLHLDSIGNRKSAIVLGSDNFDDLTMITPISRNGVLVGGDYSANTGFFHFPEFYGSCDAYVMAFAPWTTSISDLHAILPVDIDPNPASDQLIFSNLQRGESYSVVITDPLGRKVGGTTVSKDNNTANISNLANGQYFVLVHDYNGHQVQKQITVIK